MSKDENGNLLSLDVRQPDDNQTQGTGGLRKKIVATPEARGPASTPPRPCKKRRAAYNADFTD